MYIHFYVCFCFWRERWIFEHVEDLIQFETQNVSILLLIDTKLNLLYCVNNISIIDESFHLNYFF